MDINWDQEFEELKVSDNDSGAEQHSNNETRVEQADPQTGDTDAKVDQGDTAHEPTRATTDMSSATARRPSNADLLERKKNDSNNDNDDVGDVDKNSEGSQSSGADWDPDREMHALKADFYSREKHFFIVTWGGRPLYSRYGKLNAKHMISFMGVVSLFPANVETVGKEHDNIRGFVTNDTKFVYLICGPLYFFCISKTSETMSQIRNQLRYMYQLIVCTLTNSFEKTLLQSPQFDLRTIFGRTDYMLLECLSNECDRNPSYLFDAYSPVELTKNIRDEIGNTMKQCKKNFKDCSNNTEGSVFQDSHNWVKKLLFGLLLINGETVCVTQNKKRVLDGQDILLISHIVKHSQSFKQSETFAPICLPHFEPSGFVYGYISYFENSSDICLVLITVDGTSFKKCQFLRKMIEKEMNALNLRESLNTAYLMHPFECKTLFDVLKIDNPQIFAFYYHNFKKQQFICPLPIKLFNTPAGKLKLFRRLQHLHNRVHSTPHHSIYFERCNDDAAICKMMNNEYEIFILMNTFASKQDASTVIEKIVGWVTSRSMNLFLTPVAW